MKSSIPHSYCNDLTEESDIEAVWVTVNLEHKKPFKVCSFYRPPSSDAEYFEEMLLNFEAALADQEVIILGDFNLNYVADEISENNAARYVELLLNCSQLINKPTRVTLTSSKIIDLIYTSMPEQHHVSGVIPCTISDHYMTYTVLQHQRNKHGATKYVTYRDFKNFDPISFNVDLMDCNLYHVVNNCSSLDEAWEEWSSRVLGVMNNHAPLKTSRLKARSNPWMTRDIINMMYRRDYLLRKAVEKNDSSLYKEYKSLRNKVVSEIRNAKQQYYSDEIIKSKSSKAMWKTIRTLVSARKGGDCPPMAPNVLNDYFANIGPRLNCTFPGEPVLNWSRPDCMYKFEIKTILEDDVFKYFSTLSAESNIDVLGFDTKLLTCGADVLTPSLTVLFNASISESYLPADWKRARVTPIYKGAGPQDDPGNYRPISIVSHIPKALEKCINSQLMAYLDKYELLTCDQSAFRSGHSTTTAAHKLFDDLFDNINEGLINGSCFLDLKKCFDTIDHGLLLQKLEKYGIGDGELLWFKNYLSVRTQAVACNGRMSEFKPMRTGVPQGSVLGPLLFLIFINDLPDCLMCTACNIYADDTEIHCCDNTVDEVEEFLQRDVDNLGKWFYDNRLVLNGAKSYSMLTSCNRDRVCEPLNLIVDGIRIEQVNCTKYLGSHPDSMLTWSTHINQLCKKIAPKIGLLRRLRHIVPLECLKKIYLSTVQSHIDYLITVWGYTSNVYVKMVQRLQNRAARIITANYDRDVRGIDIVKELGWMNVSQRRDYFTAVLVYKSLHGIAPDHLSDLFTYVRDINRYSTRSTSTNELFVPRVKKSIFMRSLQYNGAKLWNSLPQSLRSAGTLGIFKHGCKSFILKN